MLEDRDYMRQPAYRDEPSYAHLFRFKNWSLTVWVIVINVVVFLVECAFSTDKLALKPDNQFIYNFFALSKDGLAHGYVWQLITYQFMHASFWHILFNCWGIYAFGTFLESFIGSRNFLLLLLSSGVVGGLSQVSLAFIWPQFDLPVVGASAGLFGLIAAFATLFPDRELGMLLFFVIPVRMRAKTLLIFLAVTALAGIAFHQLIFNLTGVLIADTAHLGGLLAGLLYVRFFILNRVPPSPARETSWQPRPPVEPPAKPTTTFWRAKPGKPAAELSPDELLRTQVDPILDKISAQGLHSLTAREREILEKASGKLAKR